MARLLSTGPRISNAAFPVINGSAFTNKSADPASFTASLPSSIGAGELLLLIAGWIADDGEESSVNTKLDVPSGWTKIGPDLSDTWNIDGLYKMASGGEGTSLTLTMTGPGAANVAFSSMAYRISGASTPKFGGYVSYAAEDSPNPGPLDVGILGNHLWFVSCVSRSAENNGITVPTNYTPESISNAVRWRAGRRSLRVQAEDPGIFTINTSGSPDIARVATWCAPAP
jgi:hypothetical protein